MISIQQHEDPSKYVESDLPQDQQKYKGWYWDHKTRSIIVGTINQERTKWQI